MTHSINDISKTEKEITFELDAEEFGKFKDEILKEISQSAKLKGFRQGKVPQDMAESVFGKGDNFLGDVAQKAINNCWHNFLRDKNWILVEGPEISIIKMAYQNPFIFKAKITIVSEFSIPKNYKDLVKKVEHKKIDVKNGEIEQSLRWLRKSRAILKNVEREAKEGDSVEVDFLTQSGGQELKGGSAKDYKFILGEGRLLPGFEDNIIGMKAGEHKEFSLKVPKDFWNKEIQGAVIDCVVDLKKIEEVVLPELTNEFAQKLGNFKDVEDLKNNIEKNLLEEKEHEEKERWRMEALEAISQKTDILIPEKLVERELGAMKDELVKNIAPLGISFADYLKRLNKTEEEFLKPLRLQAQKRVSGALILKALAGLENINIQDDEVEKRAQEQLVRWGYDQKEAEKKISPEDLRAHARELLSNEKVFEFLESLAK
jgi:trigger factor